MVCKLTFGVPPGRKYWCFNPCYVGLWSVSFAKRLMKRGIGGFNPCYVGLWSVRIFSALKHSFASGFNPCYVGLWSVSEVLFPVNPLLLPFQSLLCWIMVCKNIKAHTERIMPIMFQSLLCWIMVCKKSLSLILLRGNLFQSLLCWIMVCKPI